MTKQLEWDAYRYVLDDPSLDREAFEARMLSDVDLALAVAEAVSHIDALRAASSIVSVSASSRPQKVAGVESGLATTERYTVHWSIVASLAATLLAAVGLLNYAVLFKSPADVPADYARSQAGEQRLAESWLALRNVELVDVSSNLVDVSSNLESAKVEELEAVEPIATDGSSESDWLLDAAQEFYAQREAG